MEQLAGRVAVITGAARGVGRALALECAREGMRLVLADLDGALMEQVAGEARALGAEAFAMAVDVSERDELEALAERAYAEYGEVNLLMNHAGVSVRGLTVDASAVDWEWTLAVNVRGVLNGVRAFVPRMREQDGPAHIVNTASMSGLVARANEHGVYTASKHALVGLTNVLRDELEPEGIAVSCWCPSGMATNQTNSNEYRPEKFGGHYEFPVPSLGKLPNPMLPEEVAPRVLAGVRANRRYIITHPHRLSDVEQYYARMWDDYDAAARIADEIEAAG